MDKLQTILLITLWLWAVPLAAQQKQVSGTVQNAEGEPVEGATVLRMGSTQGTLTDGNGSYRIEANPNDSLRFSYYGLKTIVLAVGNQAVINVSLESETQSVDEVVIVGYGQQRKESVVAAISTVDGETVQKASGGATNLSNALVGQVPGLTTIINTGEPGAEDAQLFIRGQSTWNGGSPLILVDGVERPFTDIDPRDVESISVLKDASATAVFGVKGANGVILITTKRGNVGKPTISVSANTTMKRVSRIPQALGSYDALWLRNQAIEHEVAAEPTSWSYYVPMEILEQYRNQSNPELYPDVRWGELLTRQRAWSQQANVNLRGGTQFVRYFGSLTYSNEADIFNTLDLGQGYDPDFSYERFNFRSNLDFQVTPTTTLSVNMSGWHGVKQIPTQGKDGGEDVIWKGLYEQPPDLYPVQYSNGYFGQDVVANRYPNPYVGLNLDGVEKTSRTQVFSDVRFEQKLDFLTKGLSLNARLSYDNFFNTAGPNITENGVVFMYVNPQNPADTTFTLPEGADDLSNNYNYVRRPFATGSERAQTNVTRILDYQASVNYARTFGKHDVSALALLQRRQQATGANFPNYREDWVGRVTYAYDTRYFLEVNGAYNGSEKFAREYRFGFFPSYAVGWLVSNEKFFKNHVPFMNHLKFRYSYGTVGSDDGIDRWQYVGGYALTNTFSTFGYPNLQNNFQIYQEEVIANPDIHWETAVKQNVGVETSWLKGLISVNFDYYWDHRTDIFMSAGQRNVPVFFGADPVAANIGETKTRGWELDTRIQKYYANSFNFFVRAAYNHAIDQIIYREDPELAPDYLKLAGYQIGQTRSQINSGFINSWDDMYTGVMGEVNNDALPGDFRQIDYNADGVINNLDVVPFGYPSRPQYQGNVSAGLGFKNFSFNIMFVGAHNVSRIIAKGEYSLEYSIVWPFHLNDSWTPERAAQWAASPETDNFVNDPRYAHTRFRTGSPKGNYWVRDASYIRLQTAELAYDLKYPFLQSIGIQSVRVFANGNNLYVWTRLIEDREGGDFQRENYPRVARYNFGVNIQF